MAENYETMERAIEDTLTAMIKVPWKRDRYQPSDKTTTLVAKC